MNYAEEKQEFREKKCKKNSHGILSSLLIVNYEAITFCMLWKILINLLWEILLRLMKRDPECNNTNSGKC